MFRVLFAAPLVALVLAAPAEAKRVRLFTPLEKLVRADAVLVGKVTAVEKEPAVVPAAPGAKEKLSYRVAVVKVETGIVGAGEVTHIKIGFEPTAADLNSAPPRRGPAPFSPTTNAEGLFFLTKHPSGDFYTITPMLSPVLVDVAGYKDQVAQAQAAAAALADPMKALKADKPADRLFAANVLVAKYRAYPEGGGEVENVKVPADESQLVLKALADADWKAARSDLSAYQSFSMLGLNDKDGWKPPMVKPGEDFIAKTKEAFVKWLDGPGKNYQLNRLEVKKAGK